MVVYIMAIFLRDSSQCRNESAQLIFQCHTCWGTYMLIHRPTQTRHSFLHILWRTLAIHCEVNLGCSRIDLMDFWSVFWTFCESIVIPDNLLVVLIADLVIVKPLNLQYEQFSIYIIFVFTIINYELCYSFYD